MNSQPSTLSSQQVKISCLILTYNEAARIPLAVSHALQWADEVVVVDKSSTDNTRELAAHLGARVATIPFSRQGHEDVAQFAAQATHDWVWAFTPGEVPTRALIAEGRRLVEESESQSDSQLSALSSPLGLVLVPMHYFSFGVHHYSSPWSGGYQPRLYNRTRVRFTGIAHDPIRTGIARAGRIDCPGAYVLHQTHPTPSDFIRSHADYAVNEAAHDVPERVIGRALHQAQSFDHVFNKTPELLGQQLGWKLYWLMVALHAWGRASGGIPDEYRTRAQQMLDLEWPGALNSQLSTLNSHLPSSPD